MSELDRRTKKCLFLNLQPSATEPSATEKVVDPLFAADGYTAIGALGQILQIRLEWQGKGDKLGAFQIKTAADSGAAAWASLPNLATTMPANDFIFPLEHITGDLPLFLVRGPHHPTRAFKVRAVPIVWTKSKPEGADPQRVVVRGQDYQYKSAPDLATWHQSKLLDGVQTLTLTLPRGSDYEVWTSLQHPTDDDAWLLQDPVVDGNGSDVE